MIQTKDKIIEVVVNHIKDGSNLSELSLNQIAKEANIGKSTVYEYFKSKDEMISNTYLYLLQTYEGILLTDLIEGDFNEQMRFQLSLILKVMRDAKQLMDAIMNQSIKEVPFLSRVHEERIKVIQSNMTDRFNRIFEKGILDNQILVPRKEHKYVVQALISGLILQQANNDMKMNDEEALEFTLEQLKKILN
ncbi:Transcription regulator, TetR-like [Paracholeplasma brassicae]|uniref:Transcription regulator, TetR-like n=1 Tax=Acholeplasma brassicae TaxID=61635 RepID=U4KTD3_9MOLU|nr:TetR/AcrR family transcriptional regulator [Paracholeplasma brassicae]CCV66489.1 Transcription regulator, TetR-like [Paracholeplasma brassicae]